MGKTIRFLLRNTVLRGSGNLIYLHDPYDVIGNLLHGREVTGILDAGASNGRISRLLLRRFQRANAFAFEPHPSYRRALEELAVAEPRFNPQFVALSDSQTTVTFHTTRSPGSSSLGQPAARLRRTHPEETVADQELRVQAVRLDDWLSEHGNPSIELMKLDIQGGELKALRGATQTLRNRTLVVYTEVLFNRLYDEGAIFSEIDLFLRESGYILYNLYKPRSDSNGTLTWANALYVHEERLGL